MSERDAGVRLSGRRFARDSGVSEKLLQAREETNRPDTSHELLQPHPDPGDPGVSEQGFNSHETRQSHNKAHNN